VRYLVSTLSSPRKAWHGGETCVSSLREYNCANAAWPFFYIKVREFFDPARPKSRCLFKRSALALSSVEFTGSTPAKKAGKK
jgi:hypothetical protein